MHVAAPRPCVASSPWLWRPVCLAAPVAAAPAVVLSDGGAIEARVRCWHGRSTRRRSRAAGR